MSVFVTDASYKHTLGIVRSLGRKGIASYCGSSSTFTLLSSLSSFSRHVKQTLIYPDPKIFPVSFRDFVAKSSKKFNYNVVIPVGYYTSFVLSKFKNEIENVEIPVADYESYRVAASKKETVLLANKLKIPTPHTIFPSYLADLEDKLLGYPLVVKGVRESGFVRYAHSLGNLKQEVSGIYDQQGEYPLIQEYIPGTGYGFFALFNGGEPKAIFMHKRIREYPISGGPSTCAKSVYEPKLLEYGLRLLKAIRWHGVAMVEFRKDLRDGEFKLMEVNPKFWGSLDLALASGVDFPYLLYEMAIGRYVEPVFQYKVGVKFMWPFPDEFVRIIDKPSDLGSFFLDLTNPKVAKNVNFADFTPNLVQMGETVYLLVRKLRHRYDRV